MTSLVISFLLGFLTCIALMAVICGLSACMLSSRIDHDLEALESQPSIELTDR